jgi:predicted nucleotidyltransferase
MRFTRPLDDLFQSRSHVKVLRALSAIPEGVEVSTREVSRRAGVTHPTASTALENLRRQGVVHVRRTLWADEFRLNPDHVLWEKIRPLLRWERRLRSEVTAFLADEIRQHAPSVSAVYLFGSAARDEMAPDSDIDIDIAVICPKNKVASTKRAIEPLAELTAERFGNRIEVVVGSRPIAELTKPGQPSSRLWRTIARDGIRLIPHDED